MNIADFFVGKLKAGQADVHGWQESDLARVEQDGWTFFYSMPDRMKLGEFQIEAEIVWGQDAEYAGLYGPNEAFRVSFE